MRKMLIKILKIVEIGEALYWLARRRFTLKETIRVITGKARITYSSRYEHEH